MGEPNSLRMSRQRKFANPVAQARSLMQINWARPFSTDSSEIIGWLVSVLPASAEPNRADQERCVWLDPCDLNSQIGSSNYALRTRRL